MREYRVVFAYSSGEALARIEELFRRHRPIGRAATYKFLRAPNEVDLVLVPLDLRQVNSSDDFVDFVAETEPHLTIVAGLGCSVSSPVAELVLHGCDRIWCLRDSSSRKGRGSPIRQDDEQPGARMFEALDGFAQSEEWRRWYRDDCSHNDDPRFKWAEALLVPRSLDAHIEAAIANLPRVSIVERHLKGHPRFRLLRRGSAVLIFAPSRVWNENDQCQLDAHSILDDTRASIDALLSLTNFIAHEDATARWGVDALPSLTSRRAGTPPPPHTGWAEIRFEGDDAKRCEETLRFLIERMPDASLQTDPPRRGSVILSFRLSQRDALILDALLRTHLYSLLIDDAFASEARENDSELVRVCDGGGVFRDYQHPRDSAGFSGICRCRL